MSQTSWFGEQENKSAAAVDPHTETVNAVLGDSDAVCEGCGLDPREGLNEENEAARLAWRDTLAREWFIDIVQTPGGNVAQVFCPHCRG